MTAPPPAFLASTPSVAPTAVPSWVLYAALLPVLAALIGFGGVYSYVWAPVVIALCCGTLIYLWSVSLRRGTYPSHALLLPIIAFGLLVFIQWLAKLSIYPGETLTGLIQLTGCACVFYLALSALQSGACLRTMAWVLWLVCGLVSSEAILQFFGSNKQIYWFHNASYAEPIGPFVYHNHYAGYMCLLLPIAIAVTLRRPRTNDPDWVTWLRRGACPLLGLASVVIAKSRGGIIALAVEFMLCIWIFFPEIVHGRKARRFLFGGFALGAGFALLTTWQPLATGLTQLGRHNVSVADRVDAAIACVHIFSDHPWVGAGFNTFGTLFPAYRAHHSGLAMQFAHNEYLQALAETGVMGSVCVALFLLLWATALWRRRKRSGGYIRTLQLAAFVSTAGFLVHSGFDFQFHAPANALLFFLLTAAAVAPARELHSGRRFHRQRRQFDLQSAGVRLKSPSA